MKPSYFYLHDQQDKRSGMFHTTLEQCKKLNEEGNGIFWTLNDLKGATRRSEDVTKINTWVVEIDGLPKEEQLERIKRGLVPTLVIESKRGYHIYFFAKDATKENYANLVGDRLAPFYGADALKDYARVYRVPGFLHQKDPRDPFMIKKVWEFDCSYTEAQIRAWYKDVNAEKRKEISEAIKRDAKDVQATGEFWSDVFDLDQMAALEVLSGTDSVFGERYEFKSVARNKYNVVVNGKETNCWIDQDRKIGSHSKGGPTIAQWLKWFGKSYKEVYQDIVKHFPQLGCKK